ncbi:nucleotidyl transferase AbiEii/AbiGii toxin family protein [Agrobacterium genomosp. 2]|uniref:Nucleotidyl transferase AbiEii/AbiGii toxin family protein n=1 Tax=Agrobacterium genomosp. 2 str. CFBP 5494 TaxID=1183436 RepID=A0A9W5F2P5_9HYPH|nr:nucleotidyl transferase AbiEii/AbiGii toxin family protein [Agrobacterium genomosp. 2]CUW87534.1 conserved hypothetical protein [Agrobacterium genomosp. 2 str. CFBP 5494]
MSNTHTDGERKVEKLKAKSKSRGLDVPQQLQKYVQERLCARLWAFEEGARMTLKGGAAYHFAPEFADLNRPTADVDVHSYDVIAHEEVMSLFRRAVEIGDNDGVVFEIGRTDVLEHEHGEHQGLRIHIIGWLGKTRVNTYADVGIGGEAPVAVRELPIIPMIEGDTSSTIRVQPFEYAMAEKLHSIVVRGLGNTRMKDYRDLLILSRKGFDDETVRQAIAHTFSQRHTDLPELTPEGLLPVFSEVKQADWERYLQKNRVTGMPADLGSVVAELRSYFDDKLTPAYTAVYRYA